MHHNHTWHYNIVALIKYSDPSKISRSLKRNTWQYKETYLGREIKEGFPEEIKFELRFKGKIW
jgi:hypothetical protein